MKLQKYLKNIQDFAIFVEVSISTLIAEMLIIILYPLIGGEDENEKSNN